MDTKVFSIQSYETASVCWVWTPFYGTCTGFKGDSQSLSPIQRLEDWIESYSPYQQKDVATTAIHIDTKLAQLGELNQPELALDRIEHAILRHLEQNKRVLGIGGEHTISLGILRAMIQRYPDLVVIHFDAHQDFRSEYEGQIYNHATVFHRVYHELGIKQIYQFGIRSACQTEVQDAHSKIYTEWFGIQTVNKVLAHVNRFPLYVSLDVDVFDPSIFPATGTPEPGGIDMGVFFQKAIPVLQNCNIVGMDLVEFHPDRDNKDISAIAMALLCREFTLLLSS